MKIIQSIFIAVFVLFIGLVGLSSLDNETKHSELEGRRYQKFPKLKYQKMLDTEYLSTFEKAVEDQLTKREQFVSLYYSLCKTLYQNQCMNKVAIGKEGHLYYEPELIDDVEEHIKKNVNPSAQQINKIAKFAKEHGAKFITISIPRKDVGAEEYLPDWYPSQRDKYEQLSKIFQDSLSEDVYYIDYLKVVQAQSEKNDAGYWLHNDQHLNPYGADLLYQAVMEYIKQYEPNITVKSLEDYTVQSSYVAGGLNRRIGLSVQAKIEPIGIKPKTSQNKYERWEDDSLNTSNKTVLMDISDQTETVSYEDAYMGGNCGRTVIKTENRDAPKILISGSSFTNSLEAMCIPSFSVVSSLDFRNNKSTLTLEEYIEKDKPDYVVFIPSQAIGYFSFDHVSLHSALNRSK